MGDWRPGDETESKEMKKAPVVHSHGVGIEDKGCPLARPPLQWPGSRGRRALAADIRGERIGPRVGVGLGVVGGEVGSPVAEEA